MLITPEQRFTLNTIRSDDGCLIWQGSYTKSGYGQFYSGVTTVIAHRWWYEQKVGPIPEGYQIDHLCHDVNTCVGLGDKCPHRKCVELSHLEPVTPNENRTRAVGRKNKPRASPSKKPVGNGLGRGSVNAMKTVCKFGHEFTEENTYVNPGTQARGCRTCLSTRKRKAPQAD